MSLIGQRLWGTALLSLCALVHVAMMAISIPLLIRAAKAVEAKFPKLKFMYLSALGFALIVFAHTVQVWIWAVFLVGFGAFSDLATALYFSLVTYATLGYSDFVLGPDIRILASFAAVTGLLTFGLSTAFLVGLIDRILPKQFD